MEFAVDVSQSFRFHLTWATGVGRGAPGRLCGASGESCRGCSGLLVRPAGRSRSWPPHGHLVATSLRVALVAIVVVVISRHDQHLLLNRKSFPSLITTQKKNEKCHVCFSPRKMPTNSAMYVFRREQLGDQNPRLSRRCFPMFAKMALGGYKKVSGQVTAS